MSDRSRAFTFWLFLLAMTVAITAASPAAGQSSGLDVVVLIDQSGSMWGHPEYHPTRNDRWQHRISGTQEIIWRLLQDVEASPRQHRFSVIDFGDEAEVAWSNQVLRVDPSDPGAAARQVSSWLERRVTSKEWINTNTPQAMSLAVKEFAAMASAEPAAGDRRQILLILTDGRANLPPADRDTMRDRIRRQADELGRLGVQIWIIGLNDADDYWHDGDGDFWTEIAGSSDRARLAERASTTMPTIFYDMVDSWLGIAGMLIDNEYFCPPYSRRLVFRVNFGTPHGAVRIIDPKGFELTPSAGGTGSTPGTFVHFVRNDPEPGLYRVDKDADRHYVISVERTPAKLERLQPAGLADLASANRLVFQAMGTAGPLVELPEWPIDARLTVTPPASAPQELTVEKIGDGKFTASWTPTAAGLHSVRLSGRVKLADGSEVDVFAAPDGQAHHETVEVSNRRPYWLELVRSSPTRGLAATPWAASTTIELALIDSDGERVEDLAATVRDAASWLQAVPITDDGIAVGNAVALEPTADGTLRASLPLSREWLGARGLLELGQLHLRLLAAPDRLGDERTLNALRLPEEAEARRVDGNPMTVGPLPVRLPLWLIALALLPILVIFVALIHYLVTRAIPGHKIQRRDATTGGKVELKVFDMMTDPTGVGARPFAVGGRRFFKLDGQIKPQVDGQPVTAERFRVTRLDIPGKARARVEYRWHGDSRDHTLLLTAGHSKSMQGLQESTSRTVALLQEGA